MLAPTGLRLLALPLALLLVGAPAAASDDEDTAGKNPIRRVVKLLQEMDKRVEQEAATEQKLYDKFMCFAKTKTTELKASIADANKKIPQLENLISETTAKSVNVEAGIKSLKRDLAEAKSGAASAQALRKKEANAYAKESADYKTNIKALSKAIPALQKGLAGSSFLQQEAGAAAVLQRMVTTIEMNEASRDILANFLLQGQGQDSSAESSSPDSSLQVLGILKQMRDNMQKSLVDSTAQETQNIKSYLSAKATLDKEIAVTTNALEAKTTLGAQLPGQIAAYKQDLASNKQSLTDNTKLLATTTESAASKKATYEAECKRRSDEKLAIAKAVEILNNDDALDLFKKTLDGNKKAISFLQMSSNSGIEARQKMRNTALRHLEVAAWSADGLGDVRLGFLNLALKGNKVPFNKVVKLIANLITSLKKEQQTDDSKKLYCNTQILKTKNAVKTAAEALGATTKAITALVGPIGKLGAEIKALAKGIKDLDKAVADAGDQRKKEHDAFVAETSEKVTAKSLLQAAKEKLNEFFSKAKKTKAALVSVPGADSDAAEGPNFMQTSAKSSLMAPTNAKESSGVIAIMDMLMEDLDKELQELQKGETEAQAEFVKYVDASKTKRTSDARLITQKEEEKATNEEKVVLLEKEKGVKETGLASRKAALKDLHAECDWLVKNYDGRMKARAAEVEQLRKAQSALAGGKVVDKGFGLLEVTPEVKASPEASPAAIKFAAAAAAPTATTDDATLALSRVSTFVLNDEADGPPTLLQTETTHRRLRHAQP